MTFTEVISEKRGEPYERTMEVEYAGKSKDGTQDVFDRRFYGTRLDPGESAALMISTIKDYYSFEDGKFMLDKSVAYPKATTAGYTTYTYTPSKVELVFPMEVGTSWNGSTQMTVKSVNQLRYKFTINYFNRVTGVKEISTPAGVFNCIQIESTEEEYLGDRLVETTVRVVYYCPGPKYYAFWTSDVTLPSGKTSEEVRIPQYQTVLELEEEHGNTTLVSYKIS